MTRETFTPVKIGGLGLGRFGRLHASKLARLAEADLVALALVIQWPDFRLWLDGGQPPGVGSGHRPEDSGPARARGSTAQ